ncbi:MAG: hypothetical protein JW715_03615 [Sedimentisphaerales bacterium]|nr:hypothetical protein [Sedimentisphaerales bacterium]
MNGEHNPEQKKISRHGKGFLNPRIVKSTTFYIITTCIILSVIICILAIWDFANKDVLWRTVATFSVIAMGSALFALINHIFASKD